MALAGRLSPGKGDHPLSSLTSPSGLTVARSRGSSWLYSTLMVMLLPLRSLRRRVMPPMASPALRGTHSELTSYPFLALTPAREQGVRDM